MKCKTRNESSDELRASREVGRAVGRTEECETESQAHSKKVVVVVIQVFVNIILICLNLADKMPENTEASIMSL